MLVEIFLDEGDSDRAWLEAETGGCSRGLWLLLAKRREDTHPEDAIRVYRDHAAALLLCDTGSRVYAEAVDTLDKIRKILTRAGNEAAFAPLVAEIRAGQRRKRNLGLMKLLDRKGW
jgi:uncharacterized Zn finger protein